jgi:enoyl-CoA hydratase
MAGEKSQTEVRLSIEGAVARVTFVSPNGVNIFSSRVITNLGTVVEQIAGHAALRFVVFRGEGRVFLAGADIAEMSQFNADQGWAFAVTGHRVFDAIEALPQVTFAAIHGAALGGGCELAIACDFRLITRDAKIGSPETRLGLIPGWGGTQRLPRYVGLGVARRLMYSGESISAEEAHRIGLVDEVVENAAELDAALGRWFKQLAPGSPAAIARVKRAVLTGDEIGAFASCFATPDAKMGTTAFLEKRAPSWARWE